MEAEIQNPTQELIMKNVEAAKKLIETDAMFAGGIITTDTLKSGEQRITYTTPIFQLTGVAIDKYLLSFAISDYKLDIVAQVTHLLTLMLYDQLRLAEDHFVDINTNTVYYGDDAYEQYELYIQRKHGLVECPVCEQIIPEDKSFEKRGYCKLCHKHVIPYVTYH